MIDITNNAVEIVTPTINESLRVGNYYDDENICVDVKNVSVMFSIQFRPKVWALPIFIFTI